MKRFLTGLIALSTAAAAQASVAIEGKWTNPKRNVVIHVAPCGPAYCGHVVSASAKAKSSARKGGTATLIGAQLMSGFRPDGKGGFRGKVFEPKHNLRGKATVRPVASDTLEVRGCAIAGLLCKTQRWTRVSS